jgi:anti-anti-sigma regulatory factor
MVGLGCGIIAYYGLVVSGFGNMLGPIIGPPTASAAMRTVIVDFSGLGMAGPLEGSASVILSSALALAIIASIDALLCAKLTSQPGELCAGDDNLLVRLGIANAVSASSAERLAQIVDGETAKGTAVLLFELRRVTEIDSTGARTLGDIDAALGARGVKLALVVSGRTETAARLADIFQARDRFFPDIDRAMEWAEDDLLRKAARAFIFSTMTRAFGS